MGQEAQCQVTFGERRSLGKAHLDSSDLTFRGDFRLSISLRQVSSVEAREGVLSLGFGAESAAFELGPLAETWAQKIRHPKSRLDKLGVKTGARVAALGIPDEDLLAELRQRCPDVSPRLRRDLDVVLFHAGERAALPRLGKLAESIRRDGMIWVLWPKGQPQIKESDVFAAAKAVHLVDVKVLSVSATLSGLKLVIPRDRR